MDYSFTPVDSIHLNLNYSRSWFQTPNSYDNLNVQNVVSGGASANPVFGNRRQYRSAIEDRDLQYCADLHPRSSSNNSVFNFGALRPEG